ncbi:MAG: glycosyltransferase [Candidatus Paceibacterota bacterium]|jgi:glycosyltransferase involved in cell wall biosynthesis
MPKISIILPTYNGKNYISKAIVSVLNQTYTNWELLIIDDGSTDNVREIIEKFSQKDPRIQYIRNHKNLKLQKTLNKGILQARGMYIARIDDDDVWIDTAKLAQQVCFLNTNKDTVLIGTLFNTVDENGHTTMTLPLPLTDKDIRSEMLYRNPFGHSTVMFRKEAVISLGGYSEHKETLHMEDYDLWLRMGTIGKLANSNIISTNYLLRNGLASQAQPFHIIKFRLRVLYLYSKFYSHKTTAIYHLFKNITSASFKKIYGSLKRILQKIQVLIFMHRPVKIPLKIKSLKNTSKETLYLITVAFNSADIISIQHTYLQNFLADNFVYIIIDNSNDKAESKKIKILCEKNKILNIKIPRNPFSGKDSSKSHGLTLNWIYHNIVQSLHLKFFGFIDHDIFPIKKTEILSKLKNAPFYGHIQERSEKWYLWPGFCFYNNDYLQKLRINFLPENGMDTGGGNYTPLYKSFDKNKIEKLITKYIKISDFKENSNIQLNHVEQIGDWIHVMNASNWQENKNSKMEDLKKYLNYENN